MAKNTTAKKTTTSKKVSSQKTVAKTTPKKVTKSAPKTSVKTRAQVQSLAVAKSSKRKESAAPKTTKVAETASVKTEQPKTNFNAKNIRKPYILVGAVIVVLGVLLYVGRGLFVAAVVNGQPISRLSVIKETEKQSGKQALDTIVRNTLIEQEARKANVTVSDKEIDAEIANVQASLAKQGQKLDDALAMQGMTRDDLRQVIRLNKLVTKIVGSDVKVSDAEVTAYLDKNKDLLPQGQTEDQMKATAVEQIKQQKLNTKIQTWLESLQTKAKITYFVQY